MASFIAIVLLGLIDLSAANKDSCVLHAAVGQSATLPFVYAGLTNSHVLRWTHNNTIVFYRQQGRVNVGKPEDVSPAGSLMLKNIKPSSAGTYQATVLHSLNNTLAKTWTGRLCIMDKVSKPQLSYACDFESNAVNLNCLITKAEGLVFSWTLDSKTITGETRQTLSVSTEAKGQRTFMCSAANEVSKEYSNAVSPVCKGPTPPPVLCFTTRTVMIVVPAVIALICLLLVTVIALCCRYKSVKTQMRLRDIRDVRMVSLNKQESVSISPEYETMHATEDLLPPCPQPSPRALYISQNVSQPGDQTENLLPELSAAAGGQQPSPVPKPRTKNI
ncbi:uncharacterized protein LOC114452319 [Parambassis ranga]|uniref:Uncharacterized protein LOC114452319 n=1 Tax=Parambassis ranga TaxID=210632 RepID=A0A6P7KCQ3_9TELE|nr:uncharacterized protein LOC114452319 [Parambassis ranga]